MKEWTIALALLMLCMNAGAMAQTYTAASQGFGGEVAVTLEIEDGKLLNVTVQGDGETQGIGTRALEMLPAAMLENNSVEVDGVAGATVTSNAVKAAAADALAQSGETLAAAEQVEATKMVPGVYTGSAKGFHGDVKVEVEVTEDAITRVTVGENGETMYVGTLAIHAIEGRLDSFFDMFALWNIPMIVDKDGKQMTAMDEHYTTIAAKINEKEDSMGYTIYDSDTYGCTELLEELAAQGSITKADTLAELAEISGINAAELEKTIAAHNQHVAEQTDDEWGTPAAALQPIDAAPYYCVPRRSVVMGTITGLEVNTDMQVLREDGTAIDNLYATGEMIFGNMFNMIYPMSGTAIGTCISSGQIAALHAAANLK